MNRREALQALVALPAVKSIEVARVAPTDVIVIESNKMLSFETAEHIRRHVEQVWPGHKVIMLDESLRLRIARSDASIG